MLGEFGCEGVEAGIERAPRIAGVLRRFEAMGQDFDGAHVLAVVIVLVAHDGDWAEQRPGESVANCRKKNLFFLRHVIQQGFQESLQGVGEAFRRKRMIAMH